jgi:hypothetical protein
MMHFFRHPKIHLDCFTSERDVIEYAPIVPAIDVIPEWWKALPKSYVNEDDGFSPSATMKTCVGMIDYYDKSVALPLWSDLAVCINEDRSFNWQFSDAFSNAIPHSPQQFSGFKAVDNYAHLKITSPWVFSTKEDVHWVLTDPIYGKESLDNYTIAQGLLNFKHQNATNIQLFLNTSQPRNYVIPYKTTFLFTPLSDKEVVIHRHLITHEVFESKRSLTVRTTFINRYRNKQKAIKCPYKDNLK